jgi:uncharacterized protein (TIGR00730 family)
MSLLASNTQDLILYLPDAMRLFLAVWLFAVGGCVGSFLNVVVLRMPAGIGIAGTGSRCPVCLHPIRWFDNIPIFSWLILRGRCRDCRTPISGRYPMVELLVALLFLGLGAAEGLSGGASIPRPVDAPIHFRFSPVEYWSIYAFHVVVIVTLLAAGLIERDRHPVAPRIFLPALLVGLVASVFYPVVHPVPAILALTDTTWFRGLADAVIGCSVGGVMGLAIWPAASSQPWRPQAARTALLCAGMGGMYLGWQAIGPLMLVTSLLFLLSSIVGCLGTRLGRGPWSLHFVVCMVFYLVAWRWLLEWIPVVGASGPWWVAAASLALLVWISPLTAWFAPAREFIPPVQRKEPAMNLPADREENLQAILNSPSYLPVEYDAEFLQQWETRPVRVQLELLKPEIGLMRQGVESTIVIFGGTQVVEQEEAEQKLLAAREALAKSPGEAAEREVSRRERILAKCEFYDAARAFGKLVSANCQIDGKCDYVVVTGGGPGIMEAANRGAYDVGAKSIGLNITLPAEQVPNAFITPELCFQFHYFALRKMHFLLRAKAMVVFPGGFGTLDELFDALTLRQTKRMQEIPIILFGREFWQHVVDFQFLADEGVVADRDLDLINYADTPEEAWAIIMRFHQGQETG